MSARAAARRRVLAEAGFAGSDVGPLAADASFRSYERAVAPDGRRAVLMDAPPGKEDVRPFARIAGVLADWGLSAPAVLARDDAQGYLLLEDLGDDLFSRLIARGADEEMLYAAAVDLLAGLGERTPPGDLPPYDLALLLSETELLLDWRWAEAHGSMPDDAVRRAYRAAWTEALAPVCDDRSVLVLRDYHVDNLIWLPDRRGSARVGLLDFQDAVRGHPAYDLASLLADVRRDVPAALERRMIARYAAASGLDDGPLRAAYALLAAQRNAKIAGVFTRLWRRDGKPGYLKWLPRTWRLLRRDLAHPALEPVARWFESHYPSDPAEQQEAGP